MSQVNCQMHCSDTQARVNWAASMAGRCSKSYPEAMIAACYESRTKPGSITQNKDEFYDGTKFSATCYSDVQRKPETNMQVHSTSHSAPGHPSLIGSSCYSLPPQYQAACFQQQQAKLLGATCSSLPPQFQSGCRQDRINAFVSGQCDRLSGCASEVCRELFSNGVYPRFMPYSGTKPTIPKQVYPYNAFPQMSQSTWSRVCSQPPQI